MIHSFLMVGQSNMAGRGFQKEVPVICNENIKVFRNGIWQIMTEPINYDRSFSGVGPAASFAAAWCKKHPNEEVGLIPCAEGGSSLDDWSVNGSLFEHAIMQANLAQKSSKIEGILWHQGEAECADGKHKFYDEKFSKIADAFRSELGLNDVPIIMGGIGDYLDSGWLGTHFLEYNEVNKELLDFATRNKNCYFVTAAGLTPNPDGIHINAVSQRIFGVRYFEAYDRQEHILEAIDRDENTINIDNDREKTKLEKMTILNPKFAGGYISLEEYQEKMSEIYK